MKIINELRLKFPSRSSNEGFARAAVASFVSQLDPTVNELADLRCAVSEAVTNSIVHAYPNSIGDVFLHVKLYDDGKVVVRIRDKGCGIPDIEKAMQPLFTTGGDDRSGLGFTMMQSFADKVRVTSHEGRGTTVTLTKYICLRDGETP